MKKSVTILSFFFLCIIAHASGAQTPISSDTAQVNSLNINGYNSRFSKPSETISYAERALALAKKINFVNGIAEAYRIKGIGEYYENKIDSAISDYLEALNNFEKTHNENGRATVFNNIGNLYVEVDHEQALQYFNQADSIAKKMHNEPLLASLNLNIGNVYFRKNSFNQALKYYNLSFSQFTALKDQHKLVQCLQDLGATYKNLNQLEKAEKLLLQANSSAKALDMNESVASINQELTQLYKEENRFAEAEKFLEEGKKLAQILNNEKYLNDYQFLSYDMEFRQKHYQKALTYLQEINSKDSITYNKSIQTKFTLINAEQNRQREIEIQIQNQNLALIKFWSVSLVAGLLLIVVGLLINNVKRKVKTNTQLTALNVEILRQKDNLDRINHHLEEIIDERTKDLQIKNKKLSDYSSYLSHQIRGPIATLKGLMNLEKEGLVDQVECINMMDKCVSEIDEKIIEMSDMLHDSDRSY